MNATFKVVAVILPFYACLIRADSLLCNTRMGSNLIANVPTTTVTVTAPLRPTLTLNVQTTVTRYTGGTTTYTVVATQTETTIAPTVTDTISLTTTTYTTSTIVQPTTITSTSTLTSTVTSASTTVVATTDGFRNIRDTVNTRSLMRRALARPHIDVAGFDKRAGQKQGILALAYPTRVDCTLTKPNTNTLTVTSQLPATFITSTYIAFQTTSTSILKTTTTLIPPHVDTTTVSTAVSTIRFTSTSTVTNTQKVTTTATALLHGPTVYNACNNYNYFGPDFTHSSNGNAYSYFITSADNNGAYVGSNYKIVANGAGSMLECCNYCMQFGTCENFLYRAGSRNCFLMYHDGATCTTQKNHPNFFLSQSGTDQGAGFQIGNGLCGFAYSGNSDSTQWTVDNPWAGV